jgi:hypothetical protein
LITTAYFYPIHQWFKFAWEGAVGERGAVELYKAGFESLLNKINEGCDEEQKARAYKKATYSRHALSRLILYKLQVVVCHENVTTLVKAVGNGTYRTTDDNFGKLLKGARHLQFSQFPYTHTLIPNPVHIRGDFLSVVDRVTFAVVCAYRQHATQACVGHAQRNQDDATEG